jgi:hypothetical protein
VRPSPLLLVLAAAACSDPEARLREHTYQVVEILNRIVATRCRSLAQSTRSPRPCNNAIEIIELEDA